MFKNSLDAFKLRGCALKQNSRSLILKNNNGLLCERLYTSRQAVMKCFKNTSLLKDPMFLGGARQHWSQPGCSVLEVRGQLHRSRSRCSQSFSSAGKFQQRGAKQSFSTKTCGTRFHALLHPAPLPSPSLARFCAACRLNPSEAARARRAIA